MAVLVFTGLFLNSCSKDSELGAGALGDDALNGLSTDTFNVSVSTQFEDSFKVFSSTTFELLQLFNTAPLYPLGAFTDDQFGRSESQLICQLEAPEVSLQADQFNDVTIDSVVFAVKVASDYGFDDPMSFQLFEITENLSTSNDYYSNNVFNTGSMLGETAVSSISSSDSVLVNGTTEGAQLRFTLPNSFGLSLVDNALNNDANFKDVFKGFLIKTNLTTLDATNSGRIYYTDLLNSISGIRVYYKLSGVTQQSIPFSIEEESVKFTLFDHSFTNEVNTIVTNEDQSDVNMIQSLRGSRVKVELNNLSELVNDNVFISKAELVFPISSQSNISDLPPHNQLLLLKESGTDLVHIEDKALGAAHYGGDFELSTVSFTFNVTRHIQTLIKDNKIVEGEKNVLFLVPDGLGIYDPSRTLLTGTNSSNKPYLKIYFVNV